MPLRTYNQNKCYVLNAVKSDTVVGQMPKSTQLVNVLFLPYHAKMHNMPKNEQKILGKTDVGVRFYTVLCF